MKLKKAEISFMLGLLFAIALGAVTAFANDCNDLRQEVLRLHILANSDQPVDQQLKLEVRDAVLREYGGDLSACLEKQEAQRQVQTLLERIEETARRVLQGNGYDYPVDAQLVNMYFETRTYGDITLPAGMYDAVRITIGQAQGHNWWCVLYPPVCVPAAADATQLLEDTVAGENPQYEPRFKIVEIVEGLREKLKINKD